MWNPSECGLWMASAYEKETRLIQIASFQDLRQRVAEKENLLWCLFYLYKKRQDFFRTNLRKPLLYPSCPTVLQCCHRSQMAAPLPFSGPDERIKVNLFYRVQPFRIATLIFLSKHFRPHRVTWHETSLPVTTNHFEMHMALILLSGLVILLRSACLVNGTMPTCKARNRWKPQNQNTIIRKS